MSIPFSSTVLSGVIDKRRPVKTPIVDRHFTSFVQWGIPYGQIDVVTDPEGLAVVVSHGAKSLRAPDGAESGKTISLPRFTEHFTVAAVDLIGLRQPGSMGQRTQQQVYNRKMDTVRARFDRTLEYMAIRGCQGQVTDGKGNVLATYDVPAIDEVDFTNAPADGGDDPIDVFDDLGTVIGRALGGDPGVLSVYAGTEAYKIIRRNPKILEMMQGTQAAVTLLESGELRPISGVSIRKHPHVYADFGGNDHLFLAENELLILSDAAKFQLIAGPVETPQGLKSQRWYVDSWDERDPPANICRVETSILPVVTRPEAVRRLRVV
jgi:hypothetical protein